MRNKVNIATNPISYFIDETINIYTSSSIYKSELYRIYRNFCKIHGLSVMSSPRFQNLFIENKANIHKSFKADKFKYYNIAVYEGPYLSYISLLRVPYYWLWYIFFCVVGAELLKDFCLG